MLEASNRFGCFQPFHHGQTHVHGCQTELASLTLVEDTKAVGGGFLVDVDGGHGAKYELKGHS